MSYVDGNYYAASSARLRRLYVGVRTFDHLAFLKEDAYLVHAVERKTYTEKP
jgi:hypothetical protein